MLLRSVSSRGIAPLNQQGGGVICHGPGRSKAACFVDQQLRRDLAAQTSLRQAFDTQLRRREDFPPPACHLNTSVAMLSARGLEHRLLALGKGIDLRMLRVEYTNGFPRTLRGISSWLLVDSSLTMAAEERGNVLLNVQGC
jgi:hypothetical protein